MLDAVILVVTKPFPVPDVISPAASTLKFAEFIIILSLPVSIVKGLLPVIWLNDPDVAVIFDAVMSPLALIFPDAVTLFNKLIGSLAFPIAIPLL